jgi:hypothetical protein
MIGDLFQLHKSRSKSAYCGIETPCEGRRGLGHAAGDEQLCDCLIATKFPERPSSVVVLARASGSRKPARHLSCHSANRLAPRWHGTSEPHISSLTLRVPAAPGWSQTGQKVVSSESRAVGPTHHTHSLINRKVKRRRLRLRVGSFSFYIFMTQRGKLSSLIGALRINRSCGA